MKNKIFNKWTIVLTSLVLVFALILTAFGVPGFMLGVIRDHSGNHKLSAEQTTPPAEVGNLGCSEPVSISLDDGFKLDAPENTFETDREVTVTPIEDERLTELGNDLAEDENIIGTPICAWEVDAGLEPDELTPGQYTMTIDLREQGVPEDRYEDMLFFRVDDDGNWFQYAAEQNGPIVTIPTRRNSISLGFLAALAIAVPVTNEISAGVTGMGVKGYCKSMLSYKYYVYEGERGKSKQIACINFFGDESLNNLRNRLKAIREEAKASVERDYPLDNQKLDKYIQATYHVPYATKKKLKAVREDLIEKRYNSNPELEAVKDQIAGWEFNAFKKKNNPSSLVSGVEKAFINAYSYLKTKGGTGFRMPDYTVEVNLSNNTAGGSDVTTAAPIGFLKNPYITINTSRFANQTEKSFLDHCVISLTHELFHVCQREYKSAHFSSLRFDEATAQYVENECRQYYKDKGIVTTPQQNENYEEIKYLALPMDEFEVSYKTADGEGVSYDAEAGGEKVDSCYPFARFILFLKDSYLSDMTYHDLLSAYNHYYKTPSFTTLLKTEFVLSDEELTSEFQKFALKNRLEFWRLREKYDPYYTLNTWAQTRTVVGVDQPAKVTLQNHDYTIRLHNFVPVLPDGFSGEWKLFVSNSVASDIPDMRLYPASPYRGTVLSTRHGLLWPSRTDIPPSGHQLMTNNGVSLIEVDGGTYSPGWFSSSTSTMTAYILTVPKVDEPIIKNGTLKFKLPSKSAAAKDGKIDGYEIRITPPEGEPVIKYYKAAYAGKQIAINLKKLLPEDYEGDLDDLSFKITAREYFKRLKDGKVTLAFGPGEGNLEESMEATLAAEGAQEGAITVSLGWQTDDDLDLHVTTPNGNKIYYGNRRADGGELDVDMQIYGGESNPAEHIVFQTPISGTYSVAVNTYTDRTEVSATPFIVVVKIGDDYKKTYNLTADGYVNVCSFEYQGTDDDQGSGYEDNPNAAN